MNVRISYSNKKVHIYLFTVRVIEHAVHDVLGQFGFVGVGGSAHPGVHDALIVCALKRYLQNTQHTHSFRHQNEMKAEVDRRKYLVGQITVI